MFLLGGRPSAMNFDEFTGEIQHRLEFPDTGRTVRSIRATLMTLGERIPEARPKTSRRRCRWKSSGT